MPNMREVKTCDRCRHFKRRCDLLKPTCSRCLQAGVRCSFDTTAPASGPTTSTPSDYPSVPLTTPSDIEQPYFYPYATPTPFTESVADSPSRPFYESIKNLPAIAVATDTDVEGDAEDDDEAHSLPPIRRAAARSASTPRTIRTARKRKRNCLSCSRCHRLKVKCDKELPCGRCTASGLGRDCYYSYNKGPNSGKFSCPTAPGENATTANASWHVTHQARGLSHWQEIMTRIGAMVPLESPALAAALQNIATNSCLSNFALPGNFPFGTMGASKYHARDAVTRLLEAEQENCPAYVDRYLSSFDSVNPVLDLPQFTQEMEEYWSNPDGVSLCWLSQYLMVLGLGCFVCADESHRATELMMAAEACLVQTPFMFRPTLVTLRALTLMVVAKQVCNATCWAVDTCWSLLGLLVRTAFIFGLPQEDQPGLEGELKMDNAERDSRRKLWLTILYLDIKVSLAAGMPPLTKPEDLGTIKNMPAWGEADGLHQVLYRSLPMFITIIIRLNTGSGQVPYPEVLTYNAQLRELVNEANRVCSSNLQRITVDIFLRRCMTVLHRPYAFHQDGSIMFPESYWTSLESSLAVLMHFRELWTAEPNQRLDLVGRPYVQDFFSAALTVLLHILRQDAPLAGPAQTACEIPPRQIIMETLKSCVSIWERETEKSVCYRTGYQILRAILDLVPPPTNNNGMLPPPVHDDGSMLPTPMDQSY